MDRMQTMIVFNNIKRILFLIALATLLTSCAASYNSLQFYDDCSKRYENMVKVQDCARSAMQNVRRDGATVYTSDQALQSYWDGLVYKVKTKQISDRVAWTRLRDYQVRQNAAAAEDARKLGEFADGLNCILYGVAC